MSVKACYIEADENLIEDLKNSSEEEKNARLEAIRRVHSCRFYDMECWWDALHYLLTGESASDPIEYSMLSEAVVGKKLFSDDDKAAFIAYTEPEDLAKISAALDWPTTKEVMKAFSLEELREHDIYPGNWEEEKTEEYKKELTTVFKKLRRFYQLMTEEGKGVVISIY
jgi:hypothetical protein